MNILNCTHLWRIIILHHYSYHYASCGIMCLYQEDQRTCTIARCCHWCLYRHLCILPERFGKKDLWIANLIIVYLFCWGYRYFQFDMQICLSFTCTRTCLIWHLWYTDLSCYLDSILFTKGAEVQMDLFLFSCRGKLDVNSKDYAESGCIQSEFCWCFAIYGQIKWTIWVNCLTLLKVHELKLKLLI